MPSDLTTLFIQERQYLKNVSPATISWYELAFKTFVGCGLDQPNGLSPAELLAKLKGRVMDLQCRGSVKAISINTWLRVINAFLRWAHEEGYILSLLKVPRLKETLYAIMLYNQAFKDTQNMMKKCRIDDHNIDFKSLQSATERRMEAERRMQIALESELMLVNNQKSRWQRLCAWVDHAESVSSIDARRRMGLDS